MTRDELNKLFEYAMIFLNNLNIRPILFYGSLLGYHRENNFIEGDHDIDMLVTREQLQIIRKNTIGNKTSGIGDIYTYATTPYVRILFGKEGVDFYQYEIIEDKLYIEWDGGLIYQRNDIFPLQSVHFQNHIIHIPNNPEKVICDTYGDGWRIPLKTEEYDWHEITKVQLVGKITSGLGFRNGRIRLKFSS